MARSYSRDWRIDCSSSSPTNRERLEFRSAACLRAQAAVFSSRLIVTFFTPKIISQDSCIFPPASVVPERRRRLGPKLGNHEARGLAVRRSGADQRAHFLGNRSGNGERESADIPLARSSGYLSFYGVSTVSLSNGTG